jgi:hypothetical protein
MDLSSLADALSKLETDDDYASVHCTKIIIQMSEVADAGLNTLTYTLAATNLLPFISYRLLSYFPDISINIIDDRLLIDWS